MGLFKSAGKAIKPLVNIPRWMGLKELINWPKSIMGGILRVMLFKTTPARQETFAEAMARLKLNEEDLRQRSKQLLAYVAVYVVVALILFVYGLFLLWWTDYKAAIATFALSVAAWLLAYREHFRYFQISQRRLGCTFKEWVKFYVQGKKK